MHHCQITLFKNRFTLVALALLAALCPLVSFAQTSNILTGAGGKLKAMAQIDVNSADQKTLETLPGVGSATAKKIIAGRPYSSITDLEKIKVLTATKLNAIKDQLTFGTAVTPAVTNAVSNATAKATTTARSVNTVRTSAASLPAGQVININTASAEDLDKVPGIGPVKAKAIVDYRTQNGNFKSIDDIQKVKGIKASTFAKIKDSIKVSN